MGSSRKLKRKPLRPLLLHPPEEEEETQGVVAQEGMDLQVVKTPTLQTNGLTPAVLVVLEDLVVRQEEEIFRHRRKVHRIQLGAKTIGPIMSISRHGIRRTGLSHSRCPKSLRLRHSTGTSFCTVNGMTL